MSEEPITDDQSHYEVSLTAGQAFLAFVLLLLSLAASFAFGIMIGRAQGDERLLAQSSPSIVDEANVVTMKPQGRIVELAMSDDSFVEREPKKPEPKQAPSKPATRPAPKVTIKEEPAPAVTPEPPKRVEAAAPAAAVPHYAQLLSTSDQKRAEAFAAKLIDGGFLSAYVERTTTEKGQLFRVRVNFPSEQDARVAEPKLKAFSDEVWITKR